MWSFRYTRSSGDRARDAAGTVPAAATNLAIIDLVSFLLFVRSSHEPPNSEGRRWFHGGATPSQVLGWLPCLCGSKMREVGPAPAASEHRLAPLL
ncbi:MAG: hypothetical protein CTY20_04270 [Hyphomicrobium sp.]|nr:MAG: hypothetical protein CTY20_04270 [Hyphomicrobium sp.]